MDSQIYKSEVFDTACRQFDITADLIGLDASIFNRTKYPKRAMAVACPVRTDNGEVRLFEGYRVQDLQSFFWTRDEVLKKMYKILDRAKLEIETQKRKLCCSRREAVLTLGISKVAEAKRVRGLFP